MNLKYPIGNYFSTITSSLVILVLIIASSRHLLHKVVPLLLRGLMKREGTLSGAFRMQKKCLVFTVTISCSIYICLKKDSSHITRFIFVIHGASIFISKNAVLQIGSRSTVKNYQNVKGGDCA